MRCTIVPPHLLESIAERTPDPELREIARYTLEIDRRLRAERESPGIGGLERITEEPQPRRAIFDAQNGERLPGALTRVEGTPPSGDVAVDESYGWLGVTFALFWKGYQRDSIDGEGAGLHATVHYGRNYANAFWNGLQMVYGDGDGKLFNRFTLPVDVTAHEATHGVTQHSAQLGYQGQNGALNESVSDVFGALAKQYHLRQTADQADWLIGQGLFTDRVRGVAIRSLKAPGTAYDDPVLGKDPQPAHMRDYVETDKDNGGVHINSGIPNHAFYLVATAIGGVAWERAGGIWYDTLTGGQLSSRVRFPAFAAATIEAASRRFGASGTETQAVRNAWSQVGVTP